MLTRPSIFDCTVSKYEDIPEKELQAIEQKGWQRHLYYLQNGGKALLLEPLQDLQPRSFKVLEDYASEYTVGFQWYKSIPAPHLPKNKLNIDNFFLVKDRLVFISIPVFPSEYFGGRNENARSAMPDVLVNSWLKHGAGWGVMTMPRGAVENRQLIGHPQTTWPSIDTVLFSFDVNWPKTNMMDILKEKVKDVYITHYNPHDGAPSEWCSMRCFLDTRPYDLGGKYGDQFFVVDSHTDKVVYHIHDGDVENLRILEPDAVGEAMDNYCAHTLLRTEGRFNFLPYSRVL